MKQIKLKPGQCYLHGECIITARIAGIPATATPVNPTNNYVIVADSETTGNHHVVDVIHNNTYLPVFREGENTFIVTADAPVVVRCLMPERHDEVEVSIEGGSALEFGIAKEYDPFTARLQNVRD